MDKIKSCEAVNGNPCLMCPLKAALCRKLSSLSNQGFLKGATKYLRGVTSRSSFLIFTCSFWDKNEEIRDTFKVMTFFGFH